MMDEQKEITKTRIDMSIKVIRMYDWLLDMYVLDFFVDNHWDKLPASWRTSFKDLDPQKLGSVLCEKPTYHIFPLSFLALIKTVKTISIPRQKYNIPNSENCNGLIEKIERITKNLFLKHVKLKKRHEITLMAKVVSDAAYKSGCNGVIDFGSGLGHLVRLLGYNYNLNAVGIECQTKLTMEARKLDLELENTVKKYIEPPILSELCRPIHINMTLHSQEQLFKLPIPETIENYGLIGLHPCGDLGPLLLKHFVNNVNVKFICLVGCCFMKLTSEGYPLSEYVKKLDSQLSYVSREISCHAIEIYCERLVAGKYENLKVHAYRAALESMLMKISPKLKHAPIRSIKHVNSLSFERYCSLALNKLDIPLPVSPEVWSSCKEQLSQWQRVVTVYTLRLALAPLVETVILLDRELFALEQGMSCEIRPVFDPKISPRNHIMIARR